MPSPCASQHSLHPHTRSSFCPSKQVDDIVFEVDCQLVTVKPGADVDIGMYHPSDLFHRAHYRTGANPSAEEQEDALEEGAIQVNNIVHSFRLQQTSFDKKSFLTYLKVRLTFLLPSSHMVTLLL